MGGAQALDWAELQVLCGRQKVEAMELAKRCDEDGLRAALEQLFTADYALLGMAGLPPSLADTLSTDEKRRIIDLQDELNRLDLAAPWMALQEQAQQAYLSA